MVYTVKSQYDNSMTIQEMCHEFKLDILHHEQEIFEAMIGMEYGSILNESEAIYESKFTSVIGTIRTVILKFVDFIKNLFKKAKEVLMKKTREWSKRISEFTAKLQGKDGDKDIAAVGVDCEYLNLSDMQIKRILMDISKSCYKFCKNMEELIDYLDERYKKVVDENDDVFAFALDRDPGCALDILRFYHSVELERIFKSSDVSEIKSHLKNIIIKKETVYSDDEAKFSKIKHTIDHHDNLKAIIDSWDRINIENVDKLQKFADKLGKYDNPRFTKAILSSGYHSKTHEAIGHAAKELPKMINTISALNSVVVSETLQGYDKTNIAYMNLLKANPKLRKVK